MITTLHMPEGLIVEFVSDDQVDALSSNLLLVATLKELELQGHLAFKFPVSRSLHGRAGLTLETIDANPTGDDLLDQVLTTVETRREREVETVATLSKGLRKLDLRDAYVNRLIAAGMLTEDRKRIAFRRRRNLRLLDAETGNAIHNALSDAVVADRRLDPRDAAFVAIYAAGSNRDLATRFYKASHNNVHWGLLVPREHRKPLAAVKRRLRELVDSDPLARALAASTVAEDPAIGLAATTTTT